MDCVLLGKWTAGAKDSCRLSVAGTRRRLTQQAEPYRSLDDWVMSTTCRRFFVFGSIVAKTFTFLPS